MRAWVVAKPGPISTGPLVRTERYRALADLEARRVNGAAVPQL